jgi:hypothetical protein
MKLQKEEIMSSPEEKKQSAKKRKVSTSSSKSSNKKSKSSSKRAVVPKKKKATVPDFDIGSSDEECSNIRKPAAKPKKKVLELELSSDDNSDLETFPIAQRRKRTDANREIAPEDVEFVESSGSSDDDESD